MRHTTRFAVAVAAVTIGLSACKAELGESSSDSSSSLLSTLADMEGYQYYKHENMCNEFPTICEASTSILDDYNSDSGDYGEESSVETSDAYAVGVDADGDGVFDFVVADTDKDGVFDSVLVRQDAAAFNDSTDVDSLSVGYDDDVWCGKNKIEDVDGDGLITAEETQILMNGKISGDKCNDPDWFCVYATVHDSRCDDIYSSVCVVDASGRSCDYENSSWDNTTGPGHITEEEEAEIMDEDGNGYPNAHSYESPDNQDGIKYGEKVWCGTNKLRDLNNDKIISYEDISEMFNGNVGADKCNDPDWFCNARTTDRRCLDADVLACGIDPNGPTCGSQEAIDEYGYEQGGGKLSHGKKGKSEK